VKGKEGKNGKRKENHSVFIPLSSAALALVSFHGAAHWGFKCISGPKDKKGSDYHSAKKKHKFLYRAKKKATTGIELQTSHSAPSKGNY
jgi:hypothetical protein